ncbi:MAG: DUF4231 domain-containing protein [Gemmatimonadota bacterium]|nr:DUF4231 domain-containing protein [Gemmatimonadota bacterium]
MVNTSTTTIAMRDDGQSTAVANDSQALFPGPVLSLRVGVTGNRWHDPATPNAVRIRPEHRASLEVTIRVVLEQIHEGVHRVHDADNAGRYYDREHTPVISLVSPLAEGSDRLVASVARSFNPPWPLDVIAPEDISAKRDLDARIPLQPLWNAARSRLILDGVQNEESSLIEVNRRLLWNCDVLIALWDGNPAQGEAGTGRVVELAGELGLPVIHIEAAPSPHARGGLHTFHILEPGAGPRVQHRSAASILDLVTRLLRPPHPVKIEEHEATKTSVRTYLEIFRRERVSGWFVRAFSGLVWGGLMQLLTLGGKKAKPSAWQIPDSDHNVSVAWDDAAAPDQSLSAELCRSISPSFKRADYFATSYAIRHRGSTVWLLMLAPVAVALAWAATHYATVPGALESHNGISEVFGFFEVAVLVAIVLVYRRATQKKFHERWIDYRLLAERLRFLGFLWLMGRGSLAQRVPLEAAPEDPHTAWVNWWYRAVARQLPVPNVKFSAAYLHAYTDFLRRCVLLDQKAYMDRVYHTAEAAEKRLRKGSSRLFQLTLVFVLIHFGAELLHYGLSSPVKTLVEVCAIVLPGFGAALHAFASNLGLPEQSVRSASTIRALDVILEGLNSVNLHDKLASISVSDLAQQTASALGDDLFGWRVDYLVRPTPQPG